MRLFIFLAGAAMACSYFVTWIEPPFAGQELSPNALIGDGLQDMIVDGPWQAWVFLGGFAAAGLAALTGLLGRGSGLFCLLAGLSPVVLGIHFYSRADEFRANLGLPFEIDFQNAEQAYELLSDFIRAGLWMYLGGAAVLLLAGLAMTLGRR
ncbi:hypothetical protein [Gymnodinialimonas hymeniacidonis]|uniref:hypothetical protein n=1 Tax=Gymnodinialimonas hymeniacidonis TaxID=3126508 RepID=UPI0034C611A9